MHAEQTQPERASEMLSAEHQKILAVLGVLEDACDQLDAAGTLPDGLGESIATFLREYADEYHHAKEENLLFARYVERGMPRQFGPIAVMLHEHELGRERLRSFESALAQGRASAASLAGRDFASLLRAHIDKEDHILYPMGDRVLTPDDQAGLATQFRRLAEKATGPDGRLRHDALYDRILAQGSEFAA